MVILSTCPDWDVDRVSQEAQTFGLATETATLECALAVLRAATPAPVHQSATVTRVCFMLANRESKNQDRRERLAAEGVRWAEIALTEGTQDTGAVHYYLAVNLGLAVVNHVGLAVKNLGRIAKALKISVALTPSLEQGGPLRVLGLLYLMAPPWPQGIGDGDRAIKLLASAVEQHPDHPQNHLFYARALWEVEEEDALDQVEAQLNLTRVTLAHQNWDPVRKDWDQEILELANDAEIDLAPAAGPQK